MIDKVKKDDAARVSRSICTPWTMPTPSMLSPSVQTGTGCVLPLDPPSRSETLRARTWWRNSGLRFLDLPGLIPHSVCLWLGQPTVKPSSQDTATTLSEYGRFQWRELAKFYGGLNSN